MFKPLKKISLLSIIAIMALTGCTSGSKPAAEPKPEETEFKVSTEPVTLKFYVNVTRLSPLEYNTFFVEPIKKKYPHITLEKVEGDLEKLIVAGQTPDLIFSDNDWHMPLVSLDLPADLTDLVKKSKLDLGKFVPETIQAIRNLDPNGKELQGIPFSRNTGVLFYNKDIFDKFGVPYPKDGMLWSEVLDLSRKLTRMEDGVQYIGFDPRFPDHMISQYSQPFVDPKTNKALVDIPLYHKILEVFRANYDQPGVVNGTSYAYADGTFIKEKRLAMQPDWASKIMSDLLQAEADGLAPNWDMVTNPTFEDKVGKGRHALADMLVITKGSKYKEQAMQVIELLTSSEMQMLISKHSRITVLNDPEIIKAFGSENPSLKNKNTAAIFKYPSSPTPTPNKYDKEVQTLIRNMRKDMALDKKDINTVLRETQAAADKKIADLMKQQ
ncbi:ABC transporter substrate-binding protein [Paenibacillus sp. UNC451MF]|uniref:ABC transporter substrate-binding protein n=1 Tax=Paenibacillus sp. UNC451MF TaxID=1449063 RepID=UPI00048B867F|nr:extracellular solute-binding protein [Paenibacillus sp. UNC451MF]